MTYTIFMFVFGALMLFIWLIGTLLEFNTVSDYPHDYDARDKTRYTEDNVTTKPKTQKGTSTLI